jgi:prevent-host-death family protein
MAASYNVAQAKAHLSEILERVANGEEIVLTRRGRPVARLVPDHGAQTRPLGFARGQIELRPGWDAPLSFEDLFGEPAPPAR